MPEYLLVVDSVSVELSGYRKKSPKATAVVNFQITLSSPYWSYHSSEQTLRLTLYVIDSKKRVKKYYVLKMQSREQLAAWVAELIQASTLVRGNTMVLRLKRVTPLNTLLLCRPRFSAFISCYYSFL